ncbi:SPOR domain-containing protein [Paraburkholderia gardini]|uniref:Cell division protein DedD n=1 Tax=Paraburkholderia gardini TaxID=2823469 RepID=A0ABM8U3K2_9BURK|nr:SPOR domain-containing protein [Paraburkholderia gardini]CAG4898922.1 Cell division protein DedD [Paraburkholderia gardini]CAG4900624.1 Cell division protein DedD [Paraburkholderia gardini]
MGIFSFGKKDDAPSRRGANSSSSRTTRGERVERRTRRTERSSDADAMLLDPTLPEKQRARRRLVGAIALVVAAVVVLPMVLDSHPKPVTDDISIDIPARPVPKASADTEDTQAGVAPDNPPVDKALSASSPAPAEAKRDAVAKAPATPATKQAAAPEMNANTAAKPAKPQAPVVAANPAPQTKPSTKPAQTAATAAAADADSGTPAMPPGSRFAVQLGSFPDDASAHNWATKLKAAGVPAYTERRKQSDGSMRTLLRAGPFADRAAASAAIAKVREAGLTSGANNGAAQ